MADVGGMNWSKPIGPLPTGAWAAIAVGMVGLAYWNRKKAAATASDVTPATDVSATPGVGTGGWIATTAPLNDPSTVSTAPTTNDAWSQQAITYLIGEGYEPTIADAAIRNYINGQALNSQQQALVDIALKHFGAPPNAMSPGNSNPGPLVPPKPSPGPVVAPPPHSTPPPPPPSPQKPHLRYVTVTPWPGTPYDSLGKIARAFYGNENQWPKIFNANRAGFTRPDGSHGWVTSPSVIYPGRTLWVP